MKSLLIAFVALMGLTLGANAQCATGYTQLSNVYACQQNTTGAPVITSPSTASGTVGTGFNYQITATNSPTSFGATGLPSPLSVNTSTGLISGTPMSAGTSTIGLSATNGSGTGTENLTLTVAASSSFNVGYATAPTHATINNPGGYIFEQGPYTMPQTGAIQSISFYAPTVSGTAYLVMYSDSGGYGHTLLAQTASFTLASGWNTVNTTTNPSVTSGTAIHFAILPSASVNIPYDLVNVPCICYDSGGDSTPPATLSLTGNQDSGADSMGIYGTFH